MKKQEEQVKQVGLRDVHLPPYERNDESSSALTTVRIFLYGFVLAPIRVFLGMTTLFVTYWVMRFVLYGTKSYNYLPEWRRNFLVSYLRVACRVMLMVSLGVVRVNVEKVPDQIFKKIQEQVRQETREQIRESTDSSPLRDMEGKLKDDICELLYRSDGKGPDLENIPAATIVCNHVAALDPVALMTHYGVISAAAKEDVRDVLVMGRIAETLDVLFINKENRKHIVEEMMSRTLKYYQSRMTTTTKVEDYPPNFIIFPEGTTTAGRHLLKFHTGAFRSGAPVTPFLLHYGPYKHFNMGWTGNIPTWRYQVLQYSQIHQNLTMIQMPNYIPNANEIRDEHLYAENVRRTMAYAANTILPEQYHITCSDYLFNRFHSASSTQKLKSE